MPGLLYQRHRADTRFGAGGAKGWAHVGTLRSLQRAGYVVDAVAGSSIGAWIGAWTALGHDAGTVEQLLRDRFNGDAVQAMFRHGGADGTAVMARLAGRQPPTPGSLTWRCRWPC